MTDSSAAARDLGPNAGLIDEMYRLYQDNPQSVAPGWREFFEDYVPRAAAPTTPTAPAPAAPTPPAAPTAPAPSTPSLPTARRARGARR